MALMLAHFSCPWNCTNNRKIKGNGDCIIIEKKWFSLNDKT